MEVGGRSYVVRVSSKDAGLLAIDRENEYQNSLAAAEAGVGAGVVAYLPELGALVLDFIEGSTMSAEQLREGGRLREVAEACRGLHACRPLPRRLQHVPHAGALRRDRAASAACACPSGTSSSRSKVRMIERAMAVRDDGLVPCNNDLLAENFIWTGDRFRLIDYEYSGNNDPMFELGNIWSESNLSLAQLEELVAALLRPPARQQGRARAPAGAHVQVRLDALGLDPGRRLDARLRLLGAGAWRSTSAPSRSSTGPTSSGSARTSSVTTDRPPRGR